MTPKQRAIARVREVDFTNPSALYAALLEAYEKLYALDDYFLELVASHRLDPVPPDAERECAVARWLVEQVDREAIDESAPSKSLKVDATTRAIREAIHNAAHAIESGQWREAPTELRFVPLTVDIYFRGPGEHHALALDEAHEGRMAEQWSLETPPASSWMRLEIAPVCECGECAACRERGR